MEVEYTSLLKALRHLNHLQQRMKMEIVFYQK